MTDRRRQPVLGAGQASAAATVLTGLLVSWLARHGLLVPDDVAQPVADLVQVGIVALAGAASSLWAALWARARVTPTADPRDDDGRRLAPAEVRWPAGPPRLRPTPAPGAASAAPPRPAESVEPATDQIPVVDIAALRREYRLD